MCVPRMLVSTAHEITRGTQGLERDRRGPCNGKDESKVLQVHESYALYSITSKCANAARSLYYSIEHSFLRAHMSHIAVKSRVTRKLRGAKYQREHTLTLQSLAPSPL